MSKVIHTGPYETSGAAYDAVKTWMKANAKKPLVGPWEIYANDPGTTPSDHYKTEIYYPFE